VVIDTWILVQCMVQDECMEQEKSVMMVILLMETVVVIFVFQKL
jgi:hypothetical protein